MTGIGFPETLLPKDKPLFEDWPRKISRVQDAGVRRTPAFGMQLGERRRIVSGRWPNGHHRTIESEPYLHGNRQLARNRTDLCIGCAPSRLSLRMAGMASPYITPTGHRNLRGELDDIWIRRREVVKHLSAAAAEGDRSENAEYIYRKKQLREMDRRIRYLQRRLPELTVVERPPGNNPGQVFFGASVTLADEDDEEVTYRIVGADETDAKLNYISVDSPMARALLKRAVDDEVNVRTPGGERTYWVLSIAYPD